MSSRIFKARIQETRRKDRDRLRREGDGDLCGTAQPPTVLAHKTRKLVFPLEINIGAVFFNTGESMVQKSLEGNAESDKGLDKLQLEKTALTVSF